VVSATACYAALCSAIMHDAIMSCRRLNLHQSLTHSLTSLHLPPSVSISMSKHLHPSILSTIHLHLSLTVLRKNNRIVLPSRCENVIIATYKAPAEGAEEREIRRLLPYHLHRIHTLCPKESVQDLVLLFRYFDRVSAPQGTVLWHEGDESDSAVLLCVGALQSNLYVDEDGEGADEKFSKSDSISGELVRRLSMVKETSSVGEGHGKGKGTGKGMGGSAGQEDASSYEEISVGHLIGEEEGEDRMGRGQIMFALKLFSTAI
jgi:hypothetical protein